MRSRSSGVNGSVALEVVVEAVLDHRADGDLHLGKQPLDRLRHQMRGRVTDARRALAASRRQRVRPRQSSVSGRDEVDDAVVRPAPPRTWLFNAPAALSTSSARVPASTWCTAPSGVVTATVAMSSTHSVVTLISAPAPQSSNSVRRGLVGTGGIEPPTSSVSRKRSPTELRACVLRPALPTAATTSRVCCQSKVSAEGPMSYQFRRARSRKGWAAGPETA